MTALLAVDHLRVRWGDSVALDGVSINVSPGEALAVVGPSGSGKTSLGLALVDLLPGADVTASSISWRGEDVSAPAARRRLRGAEIGMVFQDPLSSLDPVRRIGEQVAEVRRAHERVSRRIAARRAVELLDRVHLPDAARRARQYPHELSGGMRQRVALAIALAGNPALLVADEPTTALDVVAQAQLLDLLAELRRELGLAVLLISHDLRVVAGTADRVVVLERGRVVEEGTTATVLSHRMPTPVRAPDPPAPAPPVLVAAGLTKAYRLGRREWRRAVAWADLDVAAGETLGLVGESGSGKSTTARLLVGLERPTDGRVELDGDDLARLSATALRRLRRRIQLVFQDPWSSLNPRLTVGAALREAGASDVAALLRSVGLEDRHAAARPHELSGGQRQRVAIARAMAVEPEVLVLDEPVTSLDADVRSGILALLRELQRERGMAMVFISHDLGVVREVAHRVAVLYEGAVVETGTVHEVFTRPEHPHTRTLVAAALT